MDVRYGLAAIIRDEREGAIATHQTGHNSGVLHRGVYYAPGSLKAKLCVEGAVAMERYCESRSIALEHCGKVIVAISPATTTSRRGAPVGAKTWIDVAFASSPPPTRTRCRGRSVPAKRRA